MSLIDGMGPTSACSHHLAEALCSMPNLTDLALLDGKVFQEEFYSALYEEASNLQVCILCVFVYYIHVCQCHNEYMNTCNYKTNYEKTPDI